MLKMCNFLLKPDDQRLQGFYNTDNDKVICACCGKEFNAKDPKEVDDIHIYNDWVDISDSVGGADELTDWSDQENDLWNWKDD